MQVLFSKLIKRSDYSDLINPTDWLIELLGGTESTSGEKVTGDVAVRTSTVYACVKIISSHIAMLPTRVFYTDKNGKKTRDAAHPVAKLLETRPNPYMTPYEFKQILEAFRQLYGNGYAEIVWGRDGYPKALWPLNPRNVSILQDVKGKIWAVINLPNQVQRKIPYANLFHLKGLSMNGITGISPIEVVREQIGVQKASQKFLGKFYANGTMTRGVLKVPTQLNKEAKDRVRSEWESYSTGLTNAHRIAILDAGLDYQSLGMNQADAQFIETQKFTKSEIAQIFNVPLHMLAELDRATFSNIEQQSMEFLRDTLTPLIISWEQILQYQLFSNPEIEKGYYVKFNLNSILRGDSASRAQYYEKMVTLGIMSINEIRALEELDEIENGDKHFVSLNYVSLDKMDEYQMSKTGGKGVSKK